MKIKAAVFDMDGTIVNSLMFWNHLWKRIGERYMGDASFQPCEEVERAVRTMIFADAMLYFKEYYQISAEADEFLRFTTDGTLDFYRQIAKPKEGARELLQALKQQNAKLCLASATAKDIILFALDYYNLREYFDFVISCADIGVGKERPDIYLLAQELLGGERDAICVFEDSYVALETAKKAGFLTVGIYDRYNPEQGRVRSASDLYLSEGESLSALVGQVTVE